jgi:Secretion system C-terminal sorting domain/Leucine Rich Repeat
MLHSKFSIMTKKNVLKSRFGLWVACAMSTTLTMAQVGRTSDSLQLVNLYNATSGASWTIKTNWLSAQPMNTWYGIRLDATGRVEAIDLDGLANFVRETNNVTGNNLVGALPSLVLPNLRRLYLSNNQLSGTVPNLNLPQLNILDLYANQFTGSLPNFNLPQLTYFSCVFNQLTGNIPTFTGTILEELYLAFNSLTGSIPAFNFPTLRHLALQNNRLTGSIPTFTGTILEDISLWNNQLTGTIPNFNLPNINYINVAFNQLTGTIPNFNLPLLKEISLRDNQLTGPIPNFNLPNLKVLELQKNQLVGCIPSEIRVRCPLIGASGGSISDNLGLPTQNWASYWNNGTGACTVGYSVISFGEVQWAVFPNPTAGQLTIQASQALGKVELYDNVGQLLQIKETNASQTNLDLSMYSNGLYIVKMNHKNFKIVKQ